MSTTEHTATNSTPAGTAIHSDVVAQHAGSRPDELSSGTGETLSGAAASEPSGQGSNAGRRLIKRYSNRKLYDTHASRYVTLTQIAEMVSDGENVKVVDNKTREDKTEFTFAQVILEQLKTSAPGVARGKLAEIIRECQKTRPGLKPPAESMPPPPFSTEQLAGTHASWQSHMEDQLEQLPAAEAAAWRSRLRDLNARLGELQRSVHAAGAGVLPRS